MKIVSVAVLVLAVMVMVMVSMAGLAKAQTVIGGSYKVLPLRANINITPNGNGFYGSAFLPTPGYLYIAYKNGQGAWLLIFPNRDNQDNYRNAGLNPLPLSMVYPTREKQEIVVLFSPTKLARINFTTKHYLLLKEVNWYSGNYLWIGRYPSFRAQPVAPPCCCLHPC